MNDKQLQEAAEYTEGICGEAAAILKDGVMMTIPEILKELNSLTEIEGLKKEIAELKTPIAVPLSVKSGEESEMWKDVQKIMAHTKYPLDYARTSDNKSNLNIFVVDIPKVIEILKSKYKISKI